MANQEHLNVLKQGKGIWNKWRLENPLMRPDLSGADLSNTELSGINFGLTDLVGANLSEADLTLAQLSGANLTSAKLVETNLWGATLQFTILKEANLQDAILYRASLMGAVLIDADLSGANLMTASLVNTKLTRADLTGCFIYGISVWDANLENAKQTDLVITLPTSYTITVDNLEVAQFIYLLLNNKKIRDVIDTITSKVVLILGRFTPERKAVLDALRGELRKRDYLPILFDFDKPVSRDITETISTLAHLARFIIADITDAKSIPQELMTIVPNLPSVPVQPLILTSQHEYGMFEYFTRFSWVLSVYRYKDQESLLASMQEKVITPAEKKVKMLEKKKRR